MLTTAKSKGQSQIPRSNLEYGKCAYTAMYLTTVNIVE